MPGLEGYLKARLGASSLRTAPPSLHRSPRRGSSTTGTRVPGLEASCRDDSAESMKREYFGEESRLRARGRASQGTQKPRARKGPVAFDRAGSDSQDFGGLIDAQTGIEAEAHDGGAAIIES